VKHYEINDHFTERPKMTRQLHNPMERSPTWEANSHSASQDISLFLQNPNVQQLVHTSPLLGTILSQLIQFHMFTCYVINIILPLHLTLPTSMYPSDATTKMFCDSLCTRTIRLS